MSALTGFWPVPEESEKEGLMAKEEGMYGEGEGRVGQINNGILSRLGSLSLALFLSLFLSLCPVQGPRCFPKLIS